VKHYQLLNTRCAHGDDDYDEGGGDGGKSTSKDKSESIVSKLTTCSLKYKECNGSDVNIGVCKARPRCVPNVHTRMHT
jgi:hypothetical protein